ncbi:hypothetical protein BH11BAC7_BH11BAC7_35000 [soil metagenome]
MRLLLFVFCCLIYLTSFNADRPQKKFHSITTYSKQYREWVNEDQYENELHRVFESPGQSCIRIDFATLDSTEFYDFSKLENLESVTILAGMLADATDPERTVFADQVKIAMSKMSGFSKCPKLKRVIFILGNHVFLNEAACEAKEDEKLYDEKYDRRLGDENIEAAWKLFGESVQKKLPGIELYAVGEYW